MTYFIMYQGRPIGPLNIDQVFGYTRDAATPVSRDGGPWLPLSSYPELAERLARLTPPPPAPAPVQHAVNFGEAIVRGFRGFVTFKGRSSRSEFWFWFLFYAIINLPISWWVQGMVDTQACIELANTIKTGIVPATFDPTSLYTDGGLSAIISGIVSLVFFFPNLAISIRRLHDSGRSGWWILLFFLLIPACYLGYLVMLYFALQESQPEDNEYGPVPNLK